MIDLHTHILPGVDDGAPDLETSVLMAAVAAESGVTHLVATPHSNQRGAFENYASPALQVRFDCLRAAVREAGIPLELSLGMEIFGTGDVPKLLREGRLLTINGGRYLLIEFGFHAAHRAPARSAACGRVLAGRGASGAVLRSAADAELSV